MVTAIINFNLPVGRHGCKIWFNIEENIKILPASAIIAYNKNSDI